MKFTAVYRLKNRTFCETFTCRSPESARWYARGRAERRGLVLVIVREA